MNDAVKKAVDALAEYVILERDRCAIGQDTPREWILIGTAAAYVALARDLLEFVMVAQSSDWSRSDLEEDSIARVNAVVTNAIKARFHSEADAAPVAAYLCNNDFSVDAIRKQLQE